MAEYRLHARYLPTAAGAEGGPLFVWGHGWGQSGAALVAFASRLGFLGRHVCVDFAGFGEASDPQPDWSVPAYRDDLGTFLASAHPGEPAWIVGHSFGARVGVRLAAHNPEAVRGLILMGAAGLPPHRSAGKQLRMRARSMLYKTQRAFAHTDDAREALRQRFGSADYAAASPLMRQVLGHVVRDDVSEDARAVACPTLILCGAQDTETPPEMSQRLAALIPYSTLHILPGFSHWDILTRGATQCGQMIREFTTP